ncbi:MAG: apolipoprotein N-acyltransferase [Nitrospirae bacterium]|nr:apolipoprotein N-acyltransferase [Nitrospirota bacterium]
MNSINPKNLINVYAPAFISGLLLVLCFPTIDLFGLAWIALVPSLLSLYDRKPKQAFKVGLFLGIPYFFGTQYWIYHSINHYGSIPFIVSICIVLLLSLYLSLYIGIFALLFSKTIKSTRLQSLFIAPVFWVALEFLRSYALTGFPWSSIGYTQYKFLPLIQFTDITGIYGVSFFVVAVNGAIADILLIKKRIRDMPLFPLSHTVIGFSLLFLFSVSIFVYGYWRLGQERPGKQLRVSIVQGNIEQDKKWEPVFQNAVIETYKKLSVEAVSSSPVIIVWPETAVPFYFNADKLYTNQLIDFQQGLNTYLLFGSVLVKGQRGGRVLLSNSVVLLDRDGMVSYIYDKIHLVPFGEYIPLRKILFFLDKLVVGVGDYIHGGSYLKAITPFGDFATVICYEIIFPGLVRKFYAKGGGDFIVTITNDAWFGRTTGPYQHFSMAVFRAIENRKPLIRAANTGISGFIDSNGRILSKTRLFQQEILTQNIRTDPARSFYTKYGDIFSYICIVFSVILLAPLLLGPE